MHYVFTQYAANALTSGNYTKNVIKNRAKVKNNAEELLVPCLYHSNGKVQTIVHQH